MIFKKFKENLGNLKKLKPFKIGKNAKINLKVNLQLLLNLTNIKLLIIKKLKLNFTLSHFRNIFNMNGYIRHRTRNKVWLHHYQM